MRARRSSRGILLAAALLPMALSFAAAAPAQPQGAPPWQRKLDPFLRRVAVGTRRLQGVSAEAIAATSPAVLRTVPPFVRRERASTDGALFVKARFTAERGRAGPDWDGVRARPAPIGVELRAHVGSVASLRVPARVLQPLAEFTDVVWLKAAHGYNLTNEIATGPNNVASDDASLVYGTRGAGVIVAIMDTGIEWTDRDVRNIDGTSRILAIWDQTVTDPLHPPPAGDRRRGRLRGDPRRGRRGRAARQHRLLPLNGRPGTPSPGRASRL